MGMTGSTNTKGAIYAFVLSIIAAAGIALSYFALSPSPAQANESMGLRLSAITESWTRRSLGVDVLPPANSKNTTVLSPTDDAQVSTAALADIYRDCSELRSTEGADFNAGLNAAYLKEHDQIAQACATMARLVARNAFTYGQFRAIAALQRKNNTEAAARAETDRKQALGVGGAEQQKAEAVRRNMLALQNWREDVD